MILVSVTLSRIWWILLNMKQAEEEEQEVSKDSFRYFDHSNGQINILNTAKLRGDEYSLARTRTPTRQERHVRSRMIHPSMVQIRYMAII